MMEDAFPARILLATDGSKDAELAARAAAEFSEGTGAELHVCHAWRPLPHYAYPSLVPEKILPSLRGGRQKAARRAGGTNRASRWHRR